MSEDDHKLIEIPEIVTVRDLAERIEISPIDVIKQLMANGVMANINQQIDFDTAAIVVGELGFEARPLAPPELEAAEDGKKQPTWRRLIDDEDPKALIDRPPVVTILGHVDHGKTTLLDAVRKTNVAEGEAGGITQHIGAYQARHNKRLITFLDTPGHAAFTAMRARGAQGADVAVLVVAADDGVMPQTHEAFAHARAAGVPIVVALNKVDRPNANPDRVKQQLADIGLVPDDWEGDTMVVPVSAKNQEGLEDLLEAILLISDSLEIKANPEGRIFGTVIEGEVDKSRGVMATLLVQNGTLHVGDVVLAGVSSGRVRAMFDFLGNAIEEAPPSTPVSVLGLSDVPEAGELFIHVDSEREARAIAQKRKVDKSEKSAATKPLGLEEIFEAFKAGEAQELRLVIKADVQGALEPIMTSLDELSTEEIKINVLHATTGTITENDITLATASQAIVLGFNVGVDQAAQKAAEKERVDIRLYDVIYHLTEDIEKALKGMLKPEIRSVRLGRAEVRAVFRVPRIGNIAGCRVLEGLMRRNSRVHVVRENEVIFEGTITSLKHEKDDVREIREGFECGIGVKGYTEFEAGDILECFTEETVEVE
ncbi:MAG TPA: translation initiation factor IF-2 [Anaerolineae bacterium]|nr:translation initiation factor IF-2 [Anaerolineae bacterium]